MSGPAAGRVRELRTVTVERWVPATTSALFAVLASPARHASLDGSGMLLGAPSGPERLHPGARFTMAMRQGPLRYRSVNVVTELEDDRVLAWRTTGEWRGRLLVGGQVWRWELVPQDGGTLVRHCYDWGCARFATLTVRLPGYPRRMAGTMPATLRRLEEVARTAT